MESIKLTQEQRDKLLEMAKELFPECNHIYWNYQAGIIGHSDYLSLLRPFKSYEYIHWFEFCTLHIMDKLIRSGGGKEFSDYMDICFRWQFPLWDTRQPMIHPIDYLYTIYKSLS